ncbi:hypothetical protein, partial [Meridianimarinicoccus roseus]|uniref:hypothetical protein n=1 Tax=Meridianimarinicoccus roseus TaxID=2072018 RepID=UPI001EE68C25
MGFARAIAACFVVFRCGNRHNPSPPGCPRRRAIITPDTPYVCPRHDLRQLAGEKLSGLVGHHKRPRLR